MAGYKLIKRLEVIIHLLNDYPYLSKSEILQRLQADHDITTTNRTLERDFQALQTEFGIGLEYNAAKNGYVLEKGNWERAQALFKFVELVHLGELFKESLNDFNLLKETVVLDDSAKFKGIQLIQPLLLSIKTGKKVSFIHENYLNKTRKAYEISPLQIREYLNRWYVVGVPKGENHIKTFGLDRIINLTIVEKSKLNSKIYENQLEKFNRIVGLNYDAAEHPEIISIAVSNKQYKYLESLPLHHSQQLEGPLPGKRQEVSLFIIPNYEFKMQVLRLGDQVEVISPKWLRQEIKNTLTNTLKNYTHEKEK